MALFFSTAIMSTTKQRAEVANISMKTPCASDVPAPSALMALG